MLITKILTKGLLMSMGLCTTPEKESISWQQQIQLKIVQMGNPILRQKARELSREEILSPQIQQLIEMMKLTMRGVGVGLAAPQVGCSVQIAVIEDTEEYQKAIPLELLELRERKPIPFYVIINPKMTIIDENEYVEFFEGCLSVHNCMGVVPRARRVRVECLNEKAEPVVIEAVGWHARILQHEIDHLFGTLFLDRVLTRSLSTVENYTQYWSSKPIEEACRLVKDK